MTKKFRIISFISVILMLLTTSVFAAGPQITMEGENTAKPGETKTVTIKVASPDIEVGVVSGKIEKNANVESMTVTGKNNWTLTYNQSTGEFNIYKAEGAKTEEILNIEYKLTNEEGTAKITISDINLTTIDYETVEMDSISKEIAVVAEIPQNKVLSSIAITTVPTKTTYKVGEKFNKLGMVVKATYSDGTTKEVTNYTYTPAGELGLTDNKITVTYTEDNVTKTAQQAIVVEANVPTEDENDNKVTLTGIRIKADPIKVNYKVGEKFDKTGLVVEAQYSDGTTKEITNYTYTPAGELKLTDNKVTIKYTEDEVTRTVQQTIVVEADETTEDESDDKEPEGNKPNDNKPSDKEQETTKKPDNTQANKPIDKAGIEHYTIIMIVLITVVAIISYKKYNQYKNI